MMEIINIKEQTTQQSLRLFVHENIYGRLTMTNECGDALSTMVGSCDGDHLEIGVAHGGSLILSGYAKAMLKAEGHIYGIDPLNGYDDPTRTPVPPEPTMRTVARNVELHEFSEIITLLKGFHPPLPAELWGKKFVTAFIDGAHDYQSVLDDWVGIKDKVIGMIAFHDIDKTDMGARTVFEIACKNKDWERHYDSGQIGIVRRVGFEYRSVKDVKIKVGILPPEKEELTLYDEVVNMEEILKEGEDEG